MPDVASILRRLKMFGQSMVDGVCDPLPRRWTQGSTPFAILHPRFVNIRSIEEGYLANMFPHFRGLMLIRSNSGAEFSTVPSIDFCIAGKQNFASCAFLSAHAKSIYAGIVHCAPVQHRFQLGAVCRAGARAHATNKNKTIKTPWQHENNVLYFLL